MLIASSPSLSMMSSAAPIATCLSIKGVDGRPTLMRSLDRVRRAFGAVNEVDRKAPERRDVDGIIRSDVGHDGISRPSRGPGSSLPSGVRFSSAHNCPQEIAAQGWHDHR